jgi:4-diphosphocytidyl-2-C-methyl-D-erythritol kinase
VALSLQGYHLVIVKPSVSVSTKEAYAQVKPKQPVIPLKEIIRLPIKEWKNKLVNDFEPGVFTRYPEIREIKQRLYAEGALYASMSGSGSAVFGIFDKAMELNSMGYVFQSDFK